MNNKSKTIFIYIVAVCVVVIVSTAFLKIAAAGERQKSTPSNFKYPVEAKLERFEVVAGKEQKFVEWMNYLHRERAAAVATLEGERTYFEAVFSEKSADGKTYAYWLTFSGAGGAPVENSTSELDKKHLEYWNECIVRNSRKVINSEFYLTPEFLDRAIAEHQETGND